MSSDHSETDSNERPTSPEAGDQPTPANSEDNGWGQGRHETNSEDNGWGESRHETNSEDNGWGESRHETNSEDNGWGESRHETNSEDNDGRANEKNGETVDRSDWSKKAEEIGEAVSKNPKEIARKLTEGEIPGVPDGVSAAVQVAVIALDNQEYLEAVGDLTVRGLAKNPNLVEQDGSNEAIVSAAADELAAREAERRNQADQSKIRNNSENERMKAYRRRRQR